MREIEVHVNMGIPVASLVKYTFKRKTMYIAICHACSRGSNTAVIARTRSFDITKQALELHLARHELDSNYVLKVVVTSGKSKTVELVRYYYLVVQHVAKSALEAYIKGMGDEHPVQW